MLVRTRSKPKVILDLLEEYDKHAMDLKTLTHADLGAYLQLRVDDFEKNRLQRVLEIAKQITIGSIPNPNDTSFKKLPPLTGTRDALNFMMERFQRGILVNEVVPEGGLLADHKHLVVDLMHQAEADRLNGSLTIPTGIPLIELHMGGAAPERAHRHPWLRRTAQDRRRAHHGLQRRRRWFPRVTPADRD